LYHCRVYFKQKSIEKQFIQKTLNFVYPQFLFALTAIVIPIIIHLFNFRRFKKVYFSDIRFLKEVKLQTQNRNRIKHLLILFCRIFVLSFLVFAFAQPFIPTKKQNTTTGAQFISVFVDNSFSMENINKNGMLLDEAKKIAREIALSHGQTDQFQLLTNDFQGNHQRLVNREEFLSMLDKVQESPAVRKISEVVARQNDILNKAESKNKKSFLISDFQQNISDFENIHEDSSIQTILLPTQAKQQNNLYIDSCWFDTPIHTINETAILNVRVKNMSENKLESIPIKLYLNNQQKTPSSFSIRPNEIKDIQLTFTLKEYGIQQGRIETTDFPVNYDDKFYFSFNVEKNISVACISSSSYKGETKEEYSKKSIQSLLGKDSLFTLNLFDENKIDYSSLSSQQVIILSGLHSISTGLSQEIDLFVQNGGSLIVFPSPEIDTSSYKSFLTLLGANFYIKKDTVRTKVDWVNFESDVFFDVFEKSNTQLEKKEENLDLPLVYSHFIQSHSNHLNEEVLLKLQNNISFFSKYDYKKGKVYVCAAPLSSEWSTLTKHAIFVPLIYKIGMNSQNTITLFYTLGKNNRIAFKSLKPNKQTNKNIFKIKGDNSNPTTKGFEIIPEKRIVDLQPTVFIRDQIKDAGNYLLYSESECLSGFSLNYDRKESDLKNFSPNELVFEYENAGLKNYSMVNTEGKDISKTLTDIGQGKKLWRFCILLALVFLAFETLLLRFWK
jgi:hypothetical protein